MQFYMPKDENMGTQSKKNRQGRAEPVANPHVQAIKTKWSELQEESTALYEMMISKDVDLARELARLHLPLSLYTEWYWKIDLHNLLGFLKLRVDKHAQWEIQQVSMLKAQIANVVAPSTTEAWIDYVFQAKTFSRMEMQLLRSILTTTSDNGVAGVYPHGSVPPKAKMAELGMGEREVDEFLTLFEHSAEDPFAPIDLTLPDLSLAKPAEYFLEESKKYLPKET